MLDVILRYFERLLTMFMCIVALMNPKATKLEFFPPFFLNGLAHISMKLPKHFTMKVESIGFIPLEP